MTSANVARGCRSEAVQREVSIPLFHGRPRVPLMSAIAAAAMCLTLSAAPASGATVSFNGLANTPPMGYNDWEAYGCNVTADLIEGAASYLHTSGMQADGYRYVNIDDCWMASSRNSAGELVPDPAKFPQGIAAVANYVHSLGLELGIYEDAGTQTCAGYPGSLGYESRDAQTFAAWGVDYLKYDRCNIPFANYPGLTHQQVDTELYTTMSNALKATGRPIVFSMANGTDPGARPWLWGAQVSNVWRTTTDVQDAFPFTVTNFENNVGLYPYAHPGAWNDPDLLEIGNHGQSVTEYRSQFSLWSEMAAPLIASTNLTTLSAAARAIFQNRQVIAVDQDRLGRQARPVSSSNGLWVLSRPLSDGDRAVLLFNSTSTAATISTTARAAAIGPALGYRLSDLWTGSVTQTRGRIAAFVPAHGVVMYRVRPIRRSLALAPSTPLSISVKPATPATGRRIDVTVALANDARDSIRDARLRLAVPAGWWAAGWLASAPHELRPGGSVSQHFMLLASAVAPLSTVALHAAATYSSRTGVERVTATDPTLLISPVTAPFATASTTHTRAFAGQSGTDFSILAGGTGISPQMTTSRGTRAASDSYAAVFDAGAATAQSSAQVTVLGQTGRKLSPFGSAGLLERPDMAAPSGSPEGVALIVGNLGTVTMSWSASGGARVDKSASVAAGASRSVELRLVRSGGTVTGSYSIDGGSTWTTVATATPAAAATGAAMDVGVFHSSGVAGWQTEAQFAGFAVN